MRRDDRLQRADEFRAGGGPVEPDPDFRRRRGFDRRIRGIKILHHAAERALGEFAQTLGMEFLHQAVDGLEGLGDVFTVVGFERLLLALVVGAPALAGFQQVPVEVVDANQIIGGIGLPVGLFLGSVGSLVGELRFFEQAVEVLLGEFSIALVE